MKLKDGYMIKSGDAARDYVDQAVRHLKLKQGVIGIKVRIMMPFDEAGKEGVATKQPDVIKVLEPKEEVPLVQPVAGGPQAGYAQNMTLAPVAAAAPVAPDAGVYDPAAAPAPQF
eukprot:TRINITY_DN31574_c0_g1_i1.p2 TRINITY_DN31574_c0_g1~~TRINITY_DN31574_c0_g1_i1.p2  ORF type:complete len:115 (+),score=27.68 TRINITY_DN31574_c0_g1_i1:1-345(+)